MGDYVDMLGAELGGRLRNGSCNVLTTSQYDILIKINRLECRFAILEWLLKPAIVVKRGITWGILEAFEPLTGAIASKLSGPTSNVPLHPGAQSSVTVFWPGIGAPPGTLFANRISFIGNFRFAQYDWFPQTLPVTPEMACVTLFIVIVHLRDVSVVKRRTGKQASFDTIPF